MNFIVISAVFLAACAASTRATFTQDLIDRFDDDAQAKVARVLSLALLNGLDAAKLMNEGQVRAPVFPGIPDPMTLPELGLEIDPSWIIGQIMTGNLSSCGSTVSGLSLANYHTRLILLPFPIKLDFELRIPEFRIQARHLAELTLLGKEYEAIGEYEVDLRNGVFGIQVHVKVLPLLGDRLVISATELNLGFDSLTLMTTGSTFNGEPVDWDAVNRDIRSGFDAIWGEARPNLELYVNMTLNDLLEDCKLSDLADGNFKCISTTRLNLVQMLESELTKGVSISDPDDLLRRCRLGVTFGPLPATPTITESPTTTSEIPDGEELSTTEASAGIPTVTAMLLPTVLFSAYFR